MKKVIWKFPLTITDTQTVEMPKEAQVLTIQVQGNTPCLWAIVNHDGKRELVTFEIFGTGHPVPENEDREYVGTFQAHGGSLVFHCFKVASK